MKISGGGQETYLYLNGIKVNRVIRLRENVELLPAKCSARYNDIIKVFKNEGDVGVALIFLGLISSQLHVTAKDPKSLATIAWNSLWDALLLGAIFNCEVAFNFQSNKPVEEFDLKSRVEITNHYLRGVTTPIYQVNDEEEAWIEEHFSSGRMLLDNDMFESAVHCLATHHWHAHPRARLALLWAGIEGIFNIKSELSFRLSLYIARFLYPNNEIERKKMFSDVKRLYKLRSIAVHGSEIKKDTDKAVKDSAMLLKKLIKQCIVNGGMPCIEALAP